MENTYQRPHSLEIEPFMTTEWDSLTPKQLQMGRRAAVQYAYQLGMNQQWYPNPKSLQVFLETQEVDLAVRGYIESLMKSLLKHHSTIDNLISDSSTHWKFSRISNVDLAVLRVCSAEHFLRPHLPTDIIISEAVEIAKFFGTERSGSFVHGVLNTIVKKVSQVAPQPSQML